MKTLSQKRQYFHQLLLMNGEVKHKREIINSFFNGVQSTKTLNIFQMNRIIRETEQRMGVRKRQLSVSTNNVTAVRKLRNKCLQVLTQRDITATAKDWSKVNTELEAKRYQWVLTDEQKAKGYINKKGLIAFTTVEDLQKLLRQLCKIRDVELKNK